MPPVQVLTRGETEMEVTVRLTGLLRMQTGVDTVSLSLPDQAGIGDLIAALADEFGPDMHQQTRLGYQLLIERQDGTTATAEPDPDSEAKLCDKDTVMFLYTFAGGQ